MDVVHKRHRTRLETRTSFWYSEVFLFAVDKNEENPQSLSIIKTPPIWQKRTNAFGLNKT